jgi:hypothetical protein
MRLSLLALALMSLSAAGSQRPADDTLVVITAHYTDRAQLQRIAAHFQHLMIDEATRTIRVEATHDEMMALRREGVDAQVDDAATQRLRASEQTLQAESISGYPCYRTVDETYATMDSLAQTHPTLARVIDIGPTWLESRQAGSGHRMRVLRLTNSATDSLYPNKPVMVVEASIHAREYTPAELLTRFAEWLANGYGSNDEATWLLDNFRFDLVLQANPDGRIKAESGLSWRKNVDNSNGVCSATTYGIDLNRNFPFMWNSTAGGSSGNACASTYRGPLSASEPETRDMFNYIAGTPNSSGVYVGGVLPDRRADSPTTAAPNNYRGMFLDLHSYSQRVLWPWAYSTAATGNATAFRTLGRRLAWFNGYKPQQWISMYAADGTTTDTMYGTLGVPSYTIELGVAFFESCSTFETSTLPKNLNALRYAARNLMAPYLWPAGPDAYNLSLSTSSVTAGTAVTVTAVIDDSRFNQSNGTEAVQSIASASAYVDQQPWLAQTSPRAMQANDGAFNSSKEVVSVRLSTTGLASGRHVVFVRGRDASGRWGTPNAVYFTVQ